MSDTAPVEITPANVEQILAEKAEQEGTVIIPPDSIDTSLRFKGEFLPSYARNAAPGVKESIDFPFDEVYKNIDGEQEVQRPEVEMSNTDAWKAFEIFNQWVLEQKAQDQRAVKSIGIKFIAAVWVLNPRLFNNAPGYAVAASFNISRESFIRRASDFARFFKVQNSFQAHHSVNPKMQIITPT